MQHHIDCSASTPRCTKCGSTSFERACPYRSELAEAECMKSKAVFAGIAVALVFVAVMGCTFREVSHSMNNIKVALLDISNSLMIAAEECRKGGLF
eukprot:gene8483-9349_t